MVNMRCFSRIDAEILGPRQEINTQPDLSFGPSAALHPPIHIHKYALADAPCIRTKIRRNLAHLFLAEALKAPGT